MSIISLSNVSLKYGVKTLLNSADLNIQQGDSLALIGRNGTGKTSLLKIIAGILEPDGGRVERLKSVKSAYLPQDVPLDLKGSVYSIVASGLGEVGELLSKYKDLLAIVETAHTQAQQEDFDSIVAKINQIDAWAIDSKISSIIERLDLKPELMVETVSAGLKRRVLLGRELASEPDILLLDEPTNHLDIDSVIWLEKFLKNSGKTLVFVSHDRTFLKNLSNRVIEVDRGKIIAFDCDFDTFLVRRDELLAGKERNEAVFDKKLAQEEAWLRQGVKARRTRNEGRVRELFKLREIRQARRNKIGNVSLQVQGTENTGQKVMDIKDVSLSFGDMQIIKNFSTTIFRGDKIGIIGKNGVGKTTLLNILLGKLQPDTGEVINGTKLQIAYFDQLRDELDDNVRLFDFIGGGADFVSINGNKQNIMGYLQNFLFEPAQILSDIGTLSGGEKNRLMLAKLFANPANVLVLDEPTNDLDMQTIDILENALMEFEGTILLVSHDRSFLNNIVTGVFCFGENAQIDELVGGYDDWEAFKAKKAQKEQSKQSTATKSIQSTSQKRRQKFTNKERQELENCPVRIEEIDKERQELTAKLEDSQFVVDNFDKLEEINNRLKDLDAEDEYLMNRWAELEEMQSQF